jgi:CheY-like chemotaxis protein
MTTQSHNVLVVEDEPSLRELVADFLELEGFVVTAVEDGADAIEALDHRTTAADHFCVVLLDLMLPRVGGLTVLDHVREQADPPAVVALSASREHLAAAIQHGATMAVAKPYDIEALLSVVVHYCPRHPV